MIPKLDFPPFRFSEIPPTYLTMKTNLTFILLWLCAACNLVQAQGLNTSSRAMAESLMKARTPSLQFNPDATPEDMDHWRRSMSQAMTELMRHPAAPAAEPKLVKTVQRDGYRIERWESYPIENSMVAFYMLVPDGVDASNPAAAALCIPGFGQTKELLAGEEERNFNLSGASGTARQASMAQILAKHGMVAVAVDNPSCGELSDNGVFDYLTTSRFLLEMGWSYLGLASWQDKVILDWMKTRPEIKRDRIVVSGFSLGTEPLMALGLIDSEIYAFIYNDFMCRTRERILVMNAPNEKGERPFPNSIEHLIPEFLNRFDFPDIVAALSPRPVICTEGGMDRDFNIIAKAYEKAGAPDAFEAHHYAKFADPSQRLQLDSLPAGIDRSTFFRMANVDPPHHYFKAEHVLPWLAKLGLVNQKNEDAGK